MTNDYGNLELHTVLLFAMKDIDRICREHGLKYYLHAGTLLGALNHKGFIPWDDDVDISMLRQDYEKFLYIIQKQYSDSYFVHNYITDETYKNNRTVLRVLGTKVFHYHDDEENMHNEIGLDIVPLDVAPNSRLKRKIQQVQIWFWDAVVQIKQGEIIPKSIPTKLISCFSKINRIKLGKIIDNLCMRYNKKNSKYIGLLSYTAKNPYTKKSGYENELMLREWFENPKYVQFEDMEFMTISEPEKDMIHRYGSNWFAPYPKEKRITKHDVKSYEISDEVRKKVGLL